LDAYLSSEHFKAYKPSPLVYNGAAERLGLKTSECALVAAHLGDLKAARGCGYRTVYLERRERRTGVKGGGRSEEGG
jgi:2-haloacid dehalogenase